MILRDYQQEIVEEVEASLAFDDKVVIALGMGGGKSPIASELARIFTEQNKHVVVLTNFSALIPQLARHLDAFGIKYNIVKAGTHKTEPGAVVSLIMEQSYHEKKREELDIKCDVLIKDEAHVGMAQKRYEDIVSFLKPEQTVYMTATPLDERGYIMKGIDKSNIITIGSTKELTELGHLTPIKTFVPKWSEDVSYDEVKSSGNDYNGKEIDDIVNTANHTRLVVESMNAIDAKKKKTLVYCSSIEHADNMQKELDKDGYSTAVVHSKMPKDKNHIAIESFKGNVLGQHSLIEDKAKEVDCLISVMSLAIGFDAPCAKLLVMLRPTRILRLWLQLGNRCGRLFPGMEFAEILDLAQCTKNLGFLDEPINYIKQEDKNALIKEKEARSAQVVGQVVEDEPTEVNRAMIVSRIEEIKAKALTIETMNMKDLVALYDITSDVNAIVWVGFEMSRRIHGKLYERKDINWTSSTIHSFIDEFPEFKHRIIKTYKTRIKNIVMQNKKIHSVHYFHQFLRTVPPYWVDSSMAEFMADNQVPDIDIDVEMDSIPF